MASASRRQNGDVPIRNSRTRFGAWRRGRPFVGGLLVALSGIELFFSGQLDIGKIHVQLGLEGLQATIIPVVLVLLGVLIVTMPAHRIFYGVIALAIAVYSLVGVNLGGFFVGMLLGAVGGVLTVAWMPKPTVEPTPPAAEPHPASADAPPLPQEQS
ncbi:DUF6114 domain-containing protein [Leifsonia sp. NPDC058292]|uniref:DUF6114 domain-containing protein n=1 Tax=Leifsonia sp. NPDC058292 TaxID=3346428 RepID=UPI0036DA1107